MMRQVDQLIPPADLSPLGRGGEITVECPHAPEDALRLVTLSWSMPRRRGDLLDSDEFLTTLGLFRERHREPWDLLLTSGRTLSAEPPPREIRARSGGSPVLFEVINDTRPTARWLLNHGEVEPQTEEIRSEQILVRGSDEAACYDRLSSVLEARGGVLRLRDRQTRLVLLICGENNGLNTRGRGHSALCRPGPCLAGTLGGRWVALNPAHSPYWPQIARKGFAKVGKVRGGGETMARTVARRTTYPDGTSPLAFVHANNFLADQPGTRAYASVAFGPEGRLAPELLIEGEISTAGAGEPLRWLAASYRIPYGDADRVAEDR